MSALPACRGCTFLAPSALDPLLAELRAAFPPPPLPSHPTTQRPMGSGLGWRQRILPITAHPGMGRGQNILTSPGPRPEQHISLVPQDRGSTSPFLSAFRAAHPPPFPAPGQRTAFPPGMATRAAHPPRCSGWRSEQRIPPLAGIGAAHPPSRPTSAAPHPFLPPPRSRAASPRPRGAFGDLRADPRCPALTEQGQQQEERRPPERHDGVCGAEP